MSIIMTTNTPIHTSLLAKTQSMSVKHKPSKKLVHRDIFQTLTNTEELANIKSTKEISNVPTKQHTVRP